MLKVMLQRRRTCRRLKSRSPQPRRAKRGQRISDLSPRGESLGGRRLKAYADAESDFLSNDTFIAMLTNIIREWIDNKLEQVEKLEYDKRSIRAHNFYWNWNTVCLPAIQRCNKQIRILQKDIERLERWISWLERFGL